MRQKRYDYQYEKLAQARSTLMAPHPLGEDRSFALAFELCGRAFRNFDSRQLEEESAKGWVETIKRLMRTEGVDDPTGEGTYVHRARAMSVEEKRQFSNAVDELASYFGRRFWSDR